MDGSNLSYTRIIGDTGQQPALNPPPEMVEEIRVIANNYGAEYEEGSGGTITVSTKSGTNEIHGVVYEYMQNRAFNSCNFFSPIKSPRNYNQFGGPPAVPSSGTRPSGSSPSKENTRRQARLISAPFLPWPSDGETSREPLTIPAP